MSTISVLLKTLRFLEPVSCNDPFFVFYHKNIVSCVNVNWILQFGSFNFERKKVDEDDK